MVLLIVLLTLALVAAGVTLLRYRETAGQLRIQQFRGSAAVTPAATRASVRSTIRRTIAIVP